MVGRERNAGGAEGVDGGTAPDGVETDPITRAREALPDDPERALSLLPERESPDIHAVRGQALARTDRGDVDAARDALEAALDGAHRLPDRGRAACLALADLLDGIQPERAARYRWAAAVLACDAESPFVAARLLTGTVRTAPHSAAWVDAAALVVAADSLADEPGADIDLPEVRAAARTARTAIARAPDPPEPTSELLAVAAVTAAARRPMDRDWDLGQAVASRDWSVLRSRALAAVEREAVALRDS